MLIARFCGELRGQENNMGTQVLTLGIQENEKSIDSGIKKKLEFKLHHFLILRTYFLGENWISNITCLWSFHESIYKKHNTIQVVGYGNICGEQEEKWEYWLEQAHG